MLKGPLQISELELEFGDKSGLVIGLGLNPFDHTLQLNVLPILVYNVALSHSQL